MYGKFENIFDIIYKREAMFEEIKLSDYDFTWELHISSFLLDCLSREITFELKEEEVAIYQQNGKVSEQINIEELIYYINTSIPPENGYEYEGQAQHIYRRFKNLFGKIDQIRNAVENIKIILKYEEESNLKLSLKKSKV